MFIQGVRLIGLDDGMKRNAVMLGLGVGAFIVGFVLLSVVSWFLNTKDVVPEEITTDFLRSLGAWSLIGLALIAIGIIMILLMKSEK